MIDREVTRILEVLSEDDVYEAAKAGVIKRVKEEYTEDEYEAAREHMEATPRLQAWYWNEGLIYFAWAGRDHSFEGYCAHINALLEADPTLYERLTTTERPH